jgi:hypothetical protein
MYGYALELLMRARQDDLLRATERHRLAAGARRARPGVAAWPPRRATRHRWVAAWAGVRRAVTARPGTWPEAGSR